MSPMIRLIQVDLLYPILYPDLQVQYPGKSRFIVVIVTESVSVVSFRNSSGGKVSLYKVLLAGNLLFVAMLLDTVEFLVKV